MIQYYYHVQFYQINLLFQLLAVWLTVRYRNIKDPKINPATFL
jgi:hypothetical protein